MQPHVTGPPAGEELDSIGEQVVHDAAQLAGVALQRDRRVGKPGLELHVATARRGAASPTASARRREVDGPAARLERPRLRAREQQHVVEQAVEALGVAQDPLGPVVGDLGDGAPETSSSA